MVAVPHAGQGRRHASSAALEGPCQVHGSLEILGLVQLHVHLDVLR
jgi:hypothetical protein